MTFITRIRYLLEAAALCLFYGIFWMLPLDVASWVGGMIGRYGVVHHKTSKIADANLQRFYPEMSVLQRKHFIADMWENWGRTVGEYPHLNRHSMLQRLHIDDAEGCFEAMKNSDKGAIMVGAHVANLELAPKSSALRGVPLVLIYRQGNIPYTDHFITRTRLKFAKAMYPKGKDGATQLVKALRAGEVAGILVDQKMNNGIPVPFFGEDAMTAPAVATLALRYDLPIYAATVVREGGAHFTFKIERLTYEKTGDNKQDTITIMTDINARLETWIREHPQQWFWMHNRWPTLVN
jgi:KDO2-lipid IV(A) lauroyltransferase